MAPSPQSRFIEGSMNDRTSNAPPPNYLGPDAVGTSEYERQFALDWKAPDLNFPPPPTRTSFISIGSVTSTAPTSPRSGSGSAWSRGHKSVGSSATGFLAPLWDGVKERFSLQRSKSSNTITGLFVLPTFKHKRSESASTTTVLADGSSHQRDTTSPNQDSETPKLKKAQSAAALTVGGTNGHTAFDPTKRPTREEIQANYQNLVASGFFGNRAIQSTRFSPPGQNRSSPQLSPGSPSIAHRMAEGGQEQWKTISQPLPRRQPPPPPPSSIPPRPSGLSTDITSPSSSSADLPASETVVYKPVPRSMQASKDMPPPPSPPKQTMTRHKPSLSLSSVPYSSTHPDDGPSPMRPFRPPPLSRGRFSFDTARRRSLDAQHNNDPDQQKGMKRPFTSFNLSDVSITGRTYHDIVHGVERETETPRTSAESGSESGTRKLAKKLRKSASRLSMDLISRPGSTVSVEGEANSPGLSTPTRQPLSAAIRRTFSRRLGKPGPATTSPEPNENQKRSNSKRWSGIGNASGRRGTIDAAPETPRTGRFLPPSLSVITGSPGSPSPTSSERSKVKKGDTRGRRLRRQDSNKPPSRYTHQASVLGPTEDRDTTKEITMDWQSSATRLSASGRQRQSRSSSRSRPRRSSTTLNTRNQSRPSTSHSIDSYVSSTSDACYNHHYHHQHHDAASAGSSSFPAQPRLSAEVSSAVPVGTDCMEGLEFMVSSSHLQGRARPGVPLAVVPDANRGIPSVPSIPGAYRDAKIANGRGENSIDAMVIDGVGVGAWSGPQALF